MTNMSQMLEPALSLDTILPHVPSLIIFVPYRVLICQAGDVEDIVAQHHQQNHAPSLPNNSWLLSVWRQQNSQSSQSPQTAGSKNSYQGSILDDLDPIDLEAPTSAQLQPSTIQPSASKVPVCPPSDSHLQLAVLGTPGILPDNADPSHLHSYPPTVCDIIEQATQFSHCDVTSINSFPMRPDFNYKAIEYINDVAEQCGRSLLTPDGNHYQWLWMWWLTWFSVNRMVAATYSQYHKTHASQHPWCFSL